jgi:hypothetical protein
MAELKIVMKATKEEIERAGRYQVIFKTKEGVDYCRITRAVNDPLITKAGVEQYARNQCNAFGLGGADIEAW